MGCNDVDKRIVLRQEANRKAAQEWKQLSPKRPLEQDNDKNTALRQGKRQKLETASARVAPKKGTPESRRKSTDNATSKPSGPMGQATSIAKIPKPKLHRTVPSPHTVVGSSHPAASLQSFAAEVLSTPFPQLSTQPLDLPTPKWASTYQPGMLPSLGLEVGKYGKEGTDVIVPPMKMNRPGKPGNPDRPRPFDWNWGVYTILAKIPGGKAKLNVLYRLCLEWCPALEESKRSNDSCRHCLSAPKNKKYFFLMPDGKESGWWRLADIGEGEQRKSNPGPTPGVDPRENRRNAKASSKSSQEENDDDEMAAPEESSMIDPTNREIDEVDVAQAQAAGVHAQRGNTESPITSPIESEAAIRQWTPVNRPASVPLLRRVPLPSGPTKRKSDKKEENDYEQPIIKRQRSL